MSNPACADAVAAMGTTWYYNWFGNLDSNGDGRTEGYVPDGQICDGGGSGPFDFSYFNEPRTDWPRTHVTAGDTYQFQHNNWAAHPGRFDVYLTKEGFDPTSPLTWADLELIDTAQDPPQTGGPGGQEYYYWDTTLPADRTGHHIVFTHWVRSDSAENFYSCSDVVFDGGDGEVDFDGEHEEPGEPGSCTDPEADPGVPANIGASGITQTSAHIMWGVGMGGCVTGYDVLDEAGEVITSTDGIPMVDLTDLEPDTEYTVGARSRNDNTGAVSDSVSVTFSTLAEGDGEGAHEGSEMAAAAH